MLLKQFKALKLGSRKSKNYSINLNALHLNGMTHFHFAVHVRLLDNLTEPKVFLPDLLLEDIEAELKVVMAVILLLVLLAL